MHFRQNELSAAAFEFFIDLTERLDTGGIDNGDLPHTYDNYLRFFFNKPDGIFKFISSAKEKRAGYLKDFDIFRQRIIGYRLIIDAVVPVIDLLCQDTGITELDHFAHEQENSQDHSDLDSYGKICQHSKQKSDKQDGGIAAGTFDHRNKALPFAHVIRYDYQDPGKCSHGDQDRPFTHTNHDQQ